MNAISRRQWSAAGLGLLASRARGAAHFTHPLGAELYTVRNVMPAAADPEPVTGGQYAAQLP